MSVRVMRVLVASEFVDEVGVQAYAATELTTAVASPAISDLIRHRYNHPHATRRKRVIADKESAMTV